MKMHLWAFVVLVTTALTGFGWLNLVRAQPIDLEVENPAEISAVGQTSYAVGLGPAIAPDYEGSSDYQVIPVPFFSARFGNNMSIEWIANFGRADLIPGRTWMGGVLLQYIQERDDVDNSKVDKLDTVDDSLMAGGFLGFRVDRFSLSLEAMQDIADGNDGAIVSLRGGYHLVLGKVWNASINAFTTWADDDYMKAYFSINQKNANQSGLRTFSADSGFKDVGLTFPVTYSPWEHWSIMGAFTYKRMLGDAADSPVVKDEGSPNQFNAAMFLIYRF